MPIQLKISINRPPASRQVTFAPNPLAASTRDQIFWTNNDSVPHWPGLLLSDDGKTINPTFFIPNQIAQNGDSSAIFCPTVGDTTFKYACSLHKNAQGVYFEQGVINVT
jgi:plastocyanin